MIVVGSALWAPRFFCFMLRGGDIWTVSKHLDNIFV